MDPERADSDWGLCVGIGDYVAEARLDQLPGARADAERFHAWLVSDRGGRVPAAQCKLLVSPVPQPAAGPQPVASDIQDWFRMLYQRAKASDRAGRGVRIGRRLYLYFSGHGVSLGTTREAVLLTAEAEPPGACEHVAGRLWAEWFRVRRVFDEVILVMDCCRSGVRSVHLNGPPWQVLEAQRPARQFYAFAAVHGATAREVEIDGKPAGMFTHKLLELLDDPALRPLTASRLKGLLYRALSGTHEPLIEVSHNPDDDFEIAGAGPAARASGDRHDLIVIFDDDPGAAPRVAPAVVLAGGTTLPLGAVAGAGHGTAARLVIESERVSRDDIDRILDAFRPERAVLYGRRPADSDRICHVIAHDSDSPALAKARVVAALERVPVASLQVVASDRWAKVMVWTASGELLAEATEAVVLDGIALATYVVRASLGSSSWTCEHVLEGDARIDIPPLALDTAAPLEGSSRWTAEDRARLQAVERVAPVIVVHRGLGAEPRARGEVAAPSGSVGSWVVAAFTTAASRLVLELPLDGRFLALAVPVRREQRTEVYVDGADGTRDVDVAIRLVPADAPVGAPRPTDRARESLRLAMPQGGARIPVAGLEDDPIAALLAAASDPDAPGRARLVDRAAVVLGDHDEDVIAWRGGGGIASPPLLAASWSRIAASGADVAEGSLADQIEGRRVILAPWLAWDVEAASGGTDWLRAVAGVMWPAWDHDPASARELLRLATAGRTLGAPSGSALRQTYKSPPVHRLIRHEVAAFVGATNDQLAAALAIAFVERARRPWQELTLWSLDARLDQLQSDRRSGASLQRARDRSEAELIRILPLVAVRWRVLRYGGFDIDGVWHFASLWDWQQPGGFVHVSSYRPGEDIRAASRIDIEWPLASSAPDASYRRAVTAYERLRPTAIVAESTGE